LYWSAWSPDQLGLSDSEDISASDDGLSQGQGSDWSNTDADMYGYTCFEPPASPWCPYLHELDRAPYDDWREMPSSKRTFLG
jgi:hypothetical protein